MTLDAFRTQLPRRPTIQMWDSTGLLGRAGTQSAALFAGFAALAIALVTYVALQGWPAGLTLTSSGGGALPPEAVELPTGTTTPDSGIVVERRPTIPNAGAVAGGSADVAGRDRTNVGTDAVGRTGQTPTEGVGGGAPSDRFSQSTGPTASNPAPAAAPVPQTHSTPPATQAVVQTVPGNGHAWGHLKPKPPGQAKKGGAGQSHASSPASQVVPTGTTIPPGQLKKLTK